MLSDKITSLFSLLQCNNTDIARHAGCSSSNISHLRTGNREPKPESRTISVFVEGVYRYADYENLLPVLCELCGANDLSHDSVIPALTGWLYDTDATFLPPQTSAPKSKLKKELRRQTFGEHLDAAMTTLELTNSQLATFLNIDASLVSRYRSGIHSPHGNENLSMELIDLLINRTKHLGKTDEMATLIGSDSLTAEALSEWLYGLSMEDSTEFAQLLLRSLEEFTPVQGLPFVAPELPPLDIAERYWGTDGLRNAVIRFLIEAAAGGDELLLYSDEPMEWLSGDPTYFSLWASLMIKCVKNGVHIRIIHNMDRDPREMVSAINGWLPLYISGMIEPYVFRKEQDARFCHTVFLRSGGACIHGMFPSGTTEERWYDYITDERQLSALDESYRSMLSSADPFLKTYTTTMDSEYRKMLTEESHIKDYLLQTPPVYTMPEKLFKSILNRAGLDSKKKTEAISVFHKLRKHFLQLLKNGPVNMVLFPEDPTPVVNSSLDQMDQAIPYTSEEYAEHISAIIDLVKAERNFHLTLLPVAPFHDLQIVTMEESVAVLRRQEPYAAFVFNNASLQQSVSNYIDLLISMHAADRATTVEMLREKIV